MNTEVTVPATEVRIGDGHHHGHHRWSGWTDQQNMSVEAQREAVRDGFTATALAACKTDDAICGVGKDVGALGTSVVAYAKDAQAVAYQIEGRGGLALANAANAISVEAAKNFYALNVQADKNFYATSVEAQKNAAAAELTARTLAAQASKELAECCCEMKLMQKDTLAAIASDGDKTRALLQANVIQDLRDRLTAAIRVIPVAAPSVPA